MIKKSKKLHKQEAAPAASFVKIIKKIERRIFVRRVINYLPTGIILAELAGIALVVLSVVLKNPLSISATGFVALTAAIGVAAALVSALFADEDEAVGARSIDRTYALDERFLTSHSILRNTSERSRTLAQRVQLDDCFTYLPAVKPNEVVAFQAPKSLFYAAFPLAALLTIFVVTLPKLTLAVEKTPNETVVEVIQELKTELQEPLRAMVRENPENENLKTLDLQLARQLRSLEEARDDPKKGLAIISSMERQIQETIEAFQIEATDRSFQDIAGALAQTSATRGAAEALLAEDYDKAAEELEKIDFDKIDAQERQKLAQRLENAAKTIRSRKQEQLAQLTEQLADELQNSKCASCKNTACQFAGKCKSQKSNKQMAKKLNCQLARLGLCKSNCAGACASCEMNCSGKSESGQKSAAKGNNDGSVAGRDAASNPLTGNETAVESQRELQQIEGESTDGGVSEIKVTKTENYTPERIKTTYRDDDHTFQQEREDALRNEEIPLERREVIRYYFESIRPSENAANESNDSTSSNERTKGDNE